MSDVKLYPHEEDANLCEERIKEIAEALNMIPMSVIDDIKAEIRQKQWHIGVDSANQVIEIINNHISGKEQE